MHGLVAALADEPGGAVYTQSGAITQCANNTENGFNDWFLPNKAQITALFNNRYAINPNDFNGGFSDAGIYWSSSPVSSAPGTGWSQYFGIGNQGGNSTGSLFSARCVRAF